MFNYRYNTSTFSNKEGAADRTAQRKALIAKLHHEFNGELNKVQQHIADITHQCNKCGIYNDFVYIIKENSPPSHLDLPPPLKSKFNGTKILIVFMNSHGTSTKPSTLMDRKSNIWSRRHTQIS